MKLQLRSVLSLVLAVALGVWVAHTQGEEPRAKAKPRAADAELKGFRTVETAITTRISRAAPTPTRQPGYLGINLETKAGKMIINEVAATSPAGKAGLASGDVLVKAGDQAITSPTVLRDLLLQKGKGAKITFQVIRKGKPLTVPVTLGAVSRPLSARKRAMLGINGTGYSKKDIKGVAITGVSRGTAADKAKLKKGDVILKMDGKAYTDIRRLASALGKHKPGDVITLLIHRDGKELTIEATLGAQPSSRRPGWNTRRRRVFTRSEYRLAVIPIDFPDAKHNEKITTKEWEKALFSTGTYKGKSITGQTVYGSLNDYYLEQSCGKLKLTGKVFDHVLVKKKRGDYARNRNRSALLDEALDKLIERDGKDALKGFDGLFFMYSGGRYRVARGGIYWPHRASLRHRGKYWAYFICPEGGKRMSSISVIAHEFGHMLGLPDLYSARTGAPEGLGVWCTMSTGHGRDGKPIHFSAWCKEQLGWIQPAVIDPRVKQKLILSPMLASTKQCYKVLVKPDGSEYLLLENRLKKNFDRDLPAEGLLIWRVVNGQPLLEESHGITTADGPRRYLGSIPYPSRSNDAFTPHTTPSSKARTSGGLPVHITNIRRLPDGRVTFYIGYEYL